MRVQMPGDLKENPICTEELKGHKGDRLTVLTVAAVGAEYEARFCFVRDLRDHCGLLFASVFGQSAEPFACSSSLDEKT
jgi:hypothetical protein